MLVTYGALNAGSGAISMYGKGGTVTYVSGNGNNDGVKIDTSTLTASAMAITGTGGSGGATDANNYGVHLYGDGVTLTVGAGNMSINGTGGAGTGGVNVGIRGDGINGGSGIVLLAFVLNPFSPHGAHL